MDHIGKGKAEATNDQNMTVFDKDILSKIVSKIIRMANHSRKTYLDDDRDALFFASSTRCLSKTASIILRSSSLK